MSWKKHERLPGPLNQDASKVPYSLHVPSDWANQVYKSNNRKTCVQTPMKSSTLLTSFTSCLLETNVHLLEHSGNNGPQCEESSSKYVCFKQWHQFVFISHHHLISEPNLNKLDVTKSLSQVLTVSMVSAFTHCLLTGMFTQTPFWGTALIFCSWIRYISAETETFSLVN